MSEPLVQVRDLSVGFIGGGRTVQALDGVSLDLERGEVLALIGESGSGKSVTLRSILRLNPARGTRTTGAIRFEGRDVLAMGARELGAFRGGEAAMIFQEPLLALDPVYTVGAQIIEAIRRHRPVSAAEARARTLALFQRVRIPSPERRLDAYPHEMSGGMRQRAMIALALSCSPRLLLADEPTTALDATVQIQVLLLLRELQRELGLSIIFVTHDIGAAVEIADRVAVMYAGRIVEEGSTREIVRDPRHPYTIGLLRSRAHGVGREGARLDTIAGSPPDMADPPRGCLFAPRCGFAGEGCLRERPPLVELGPGRRARCVRLDAVSQFAGA